MSERTLTPYPLSPAARGRGEAEELLSMYCDLTWAQYEDLLNLSAGRLKQMHSARRAAMMELVDEHLMVTWHGHQVLNRAIGLIEGTWKPLVRDGEIHDAMRMAIWARKEYDGGHWIRSVHLKLINALWRRPGQTYRYLTRVYGHAVVQEFFQRELATGKPMMGSAVRMSPLGEQLLYWCMRREMA